MAGKMRAICLKIKRLPLTITQGSRLRDFRLENFFASLRNLFYYGKFIEIKKNY